MHRILIVDDEKVIVNSLASYLEERFDAEIHRAYNAIDARDILKNAKFSIVITDISMPAVSGLELLDFIKKYWPACWVIMLTAYSDFQYAYDTLRYDRVDYILKVEEYNTVWETVKKRLDLINHEEETKDFYYMLDKKVSHMSSYLKGSTLDRLFRYGEIMEQNELDILEIPLQLEKPLLMVTGILQEDHIKKRSGHIFNFLSYLEENMSLRKIKTVSHDMDGNLLWLLQLEEGNEQSEEDAVIYVREIFSELPETVYDRSGENLTLAMNSRFVPVRELWEVYRDSICFMEDFSGERCMRMVQADGIKYNEERMTYPSTEELSYLLTLLKAEKTEELLNTITRKMDFCHEIKDLRKLLPLPAVAAMEVLLTEAYRLCGTGDASYKSFVRKLYASDIEISGTLWLEEAVHMLKSLLDERIKTKYSNSTNLIKWINSYVDDHYTETLSLTSLAEKVNYNPSYLSRVYKEQMGLSLVSYINRKRVELAKQLLVESGMKIKEIAFQSGFYSVRHFNQVFKQYTGVSAGAYRQQ